MVRAQEHIAHAYLQGVVVIDRPGMESRVFVFDKYSSGRCVELDNMGKTQQTSNTMMDCMRPTYVQQHTYVQPTTSLKLNILAADLGVAASALHVSSEMKMFGSLLLTKVYTLHFITCMD